MGPVVRECPECVAEAKRESAAKLAAEASVVPFVDPMIEVNRLKAGFPKRFAGCRFETFEVANDGQRLALETATGYVRHFREDVSQTGTCLSFMGTVGTGKTHLACAIGNALVDQGFTVLYTTARQAVNRIKETWRRDCPSTEADALAELLAPDLLLFDEVGVQFNTEAEKVLMFDIIDGRYRDKKPTVVMSNLLLDGLNEYMGPRSVDRLRENGGALVEFQWESYRR